MWIWLFSKRKILVFKSHSGIVKYATIRISWPFKKITVFRKVVAEGYTIVTDYSTITPILPIGIKFFEAIYYNVCSDMKIKIIVGVKK
ncbi:MAG: hypothetical protein KAS32_13955 [Candidatus Peribacteraceae bacterium]|nr:hypothetical protein [Candidatus Peribacteraceae bacterium]